jgi:hypothetical protein
VKIKITQAAIEAGAKRYSKIKYPEDGYTDLGVVEEILEAALPHLQPPIQSTPAPSSLANDAGEGGLNSDCKVSTQNVQSHAATATNVAGEEEWVRVAHALRIAEYGPAASEDTWTKLPEDVRALREKQARAAIRAIREGGERWGVWLKNLNKWRDQRIGNTCTNQPFVTTDHAAAEHVASDWNRELEADYAEVRPYPPARAKTPEEIADECLAPIDIKDKHRRIAAAIRDARKEKTNGK